METRISVRYSSQGASVPTRWGHQLNGNSPSRVCFYATILAQVPTRWGHQLNGNVTSTSWWLKALGPHSLGTSIEWKP